jgi:hypothetical protein
MATCNVVVPYKNDCLFLNKVIDSFEKLLAFMPDEKFASTVVARLQYDGSASLTEELTLNLQGSMMFIYGTVMKKPLPKIYTPHDISLINQIWDYLKHPEYKIIM